VDAYLDKFAKIPRQQKWLALFSIVVGFALLHYFFIYREQAQQLEIHLIQLDKFNIDVVEKQALADNLKRYTEEVARLKRDLERAKSLLPDESEVPALLAQISSLGSKAGLEISRFEPLPEELKDFYARLPFRVKVSGNYHEVATFIDSVGHLERIVNVENISMKEPVMKNKKYVVSTEFTVTTYRFVDHPAADEKKKPGAKT